MAVTSIQTPDGYNHAVVDANISMGTSGGDAALVHMNPSTESFEPFFKFGTINGVQLDHRSVKQAFRLPVTETYLSVQENEIILTRHHYNHSDSSGQTTITSNSSKLLVADTSTGLTLGSEGTLSWDGKIVTSTQQWGSTVSFDENTTGGIILMTTAQSAAMSYPTMTTDNYFLIEMENMNFMADFGFYLISIPGTSVPSTGYYNALKFNCRYQEGAFDVNIDKYRTDGAGSLDYVSQTGRYTSNKIWCFGQLLTDSMYLPSLYNNNLVLLPDTERMLLEGATVKVSLFKATGYVSYETAIKSKQDKPTFDSETNTLIFP